jgi:hypothetical protein
MPPAPEASLTAALAAVAALGAPAPLERERGGAALDAALDAAGA